MGRERVAQGNRHGPERLDDGLDGLLVELVVLGDLPTSRGRPFPALLEGVTTLLERVSPSALTPTERRGLALHLVEPTLGRNAAKPFSNVLREPDEGLSLGVHGI